VTLTELNAMDGLGPSTNSKTVFLDSGDEAPTEILLKMKKEKVTT
jgi:hypothetical protein